MTAPYGSMSYSYDALRRLSSRTTNSYYGTVLFTRSYAYLAGSGTNVTTTLVGTVSNGSFGSYTYAYDANGNITSVSGSAAASYTYDSQNRLLSETRGGTTYSYTYDGAGNLLSKTKTTGSGTDSYTYGDSTWKDLLTAYNGSSITYDAIGNPTLWYDGATMTWANGRRLASISATSDHGAMSFTYDADGLRLTKTVGNETHKYLWQGGLLVSESWGNNTLEFYYDESGRPFALNYNDVVYYYITNLQGDVVKISNPTGTVAAEYSYNAWGELLSATGAMAAINPLRYRGYYYDSESGLYYLKSRYYDPALCRFINADGLASTGQGFTGTNMFAYCLDNPVNLVDNSGNDAGTAVIEWASSMWWLTLIDGPLPIGDIIYWAGIIVIGIISVDYVLSNPPVIPAAKEPELPDVEYPGDDPQKAPEGTEWRGNGERGSNEGNYYNPESGETWHPDLDHAEPIGPHWDYNYRGSGSNGWRVYLDGRIIAKFLNMMQY